MTDTTPHPGIRRVLAAYDAVTSDEASLSDLAEMVARLQAELELLFVEDVNLVRVAGLPLARQINIRTGAAGPLAPGELEADMRATGARMMRRLADAADRRHIRWSFRTVRGEAADEVVLASEAADLLVLRHGRNWPRRRSADADPAAVARRARPSVLLLEHGAQAPRSPALVFRPGEQGRRALAFAVRLAVAGHDVLDILVPDGKLLDAATQAAESVAGSGRPAARIRCRVTRLAKTDVLSDAAERARKRLLVIGADDPVLKSPGALERLIGSACPVLLVR